MEFEKSIGIDDLIYKAEIETQTQRTNIWRPREWRVGEMNWEIEIEVQTIDTMYKIDG